MFPYVPRYANKARIVWNGPMQHEADEFFKCLDHYFGEGKEWHFYNIDKKRRPLVSFVSKSPFMKAKKANASA
jgi:hypothetical protein